mgnify:CR=1 FL=1|jgi:nitrogen fixation NifU-like protein|tara:strand:+ start:245 stop:670 length:426 start_codon:yes stop_codon:yes gene_type:complete
MLSNELNDLYKEVILDHYKNPRNSELLEDPLYKARGYNPFCGDEINLQINVDNNQVIQEVGFQGHGCAISQATASLMTESIKGKSINEALEIREEFRKMMQGENINLELLQDLEILEGVRNFPVRIKCSLLSWSTLEDSVS